MLPLFYDDSEGWLRIMRQCIALTASFFNTHRMVRQYVTHAYAADLVDPGARRHD